ncbi:copper-binding protein [Lacisediminimonas sp.]|uniref:copper-binding protein n=1 Tax=Lacisediminimonas sp. TaxID=3060582 RepID=UPI002722B5FD|nr:copper-binding protein [Lacisediminimonas sp.]MDO8299983.1 copper-binding protein [Lacisediminimonas sp.]
MKTAQYPNLLKAALALCLAAPLSAVQANDAHHPATAATPASNSGAGVVSDGGNASNADAALSDGEIRKVDKEQGKLTIRHGPLANLDMPPMTMVFRVKDPALLDQVAAGEKIRFRAEKIEGQYVVTIIRKLTNGGT